MTRVCSKKRNVLYYIINIITATSIHLYYIVEEYTRSGQDFSASLGGDSLRQKEKERERRSRRYVSGINVLIEPDVDAKAAVL